MRLRQSGNEKKCRTEKPWWKRSSRSCEITSPDRGRDCFKESVTFFQRNKLISILSTSLWTVCDELLDWLLSLISFQSHLFIYSWMLITGLHLVPDGTRNIGVREGNKSWNLSCYPRQWFRRFLASVSVIVNKLNQSHRMRRSYIKTILSCGFCILLHPDGGFSQRPTARGGG